VSVVVQPRVARRLIAAGAAAIALLGLLLVLLVATLMGGLAPPNTCAPGAGTRYAPSPVALADIPGNYLQWIRQAGDRYGLDWSVIAGIYSIETDFGRLDAPGVRSGESAAAAGGPGQFLERTWRVNGVDRHSDGVKDRYNPTDAIPGTANLLRRSGAPADYRRAVFAYNHASWYVDDVLARAARYRGAAKADPDAVQSTLVADASTTAACTELVGAGGPADLNGP
jgi:membrane-bound lytic murein transglycosylase B